MIRFIRRSAIFCASVLFSMSLPVAHMMPTAFAAPPNPSIDAAGQWHRPGPGFVGNASTESGDDLYIIGHQAPSLARYRGDIAGLAPTSPEATGAARLDTNAEASQAYLAYLASVHSNLKAAIEAQLGRSVEVAHRYDAVFNGIAVRLNAAEAQQISTLTGVRSVTRDYSRELHTDNGPRWIGADAIWGEEPPTGNAACVGNCGEGVVVGIIDTGVNHDHPSFADVGDDGYDHTNPRGQFYGACDAVTGLPFCNDKLIGFRDFTGTGPEDDNGHGSHTASTTAGNVLNIELIAPTITVERAISGVAPHANIISYKGCSGLPVGCLISALLGSINAATLDMVDVINYSIGGASSNPWADLDAQAFFDAYEAGIFVATSASNDGPGFGTLGSPADAPWVTSVGASTHDRKLANGIVDMTNADSSAGPADIFGASLTSPLPPARVVYAGDYGAPLCGAGTGDPATGEGSGGNPFPSGTFNGEIVVCDRGEYGRVHKSDNVYEAGAGGFVLANDAANGDSLVGDAYPLPGVHISYDDGVILKAWIANNGGLAHQGTARINGSNPSSAPKFADIMASFSSRGANPAAPSLVKPDVTAPGVDILAAWMTEAGTLPGGDPEFNVISGTSMSSPHTAGSGALIRAVHPDWSPDEVKSALMTTAFTTDPGNGAETHPVYKEDGATLADPFDMGAGRVDLHVAADAGFVLDETAANYTAADPGAGGDVTTLNIASLGNDNCGTFSVDGSCSWTRTLKGTAPGSVTWTVTATGDAGMVISADPALFTLNPGQTIEIEFTADVSGSPKNNWIFGEVQFTPSASVPPAHFPVAVIPKPPGGGFGGVDLFMHGNGHDLCDDGVTPYAGVGEVDGASTQCLPFLSEDDQLDPINSAATWGPLQPGLNGTAFDPRWVWKLDEDKRLAGNMVVEWWASQGTTDTGILFDTNFDITITVDGTPHVIDHRVAHIFATPGQPQLLRSVVPIPDITASSTVEVMIEPVFIDSGNTVTFYYDSTQPCITGGSGSCDSRVSMPVITGPIAPVANDDFVLISSGETTVIDVLANDFDPEGGPLAVQIISGPSNGNAELTSGNAIVYTHNGSATSSDTIVYRITDNDGLTADATIHISIAGACTAAPDYADNFETGAPGWTVDTAVLVNPAGLPASNTWDLRIDPTAQSPLTAFNTDAIAQDPVDNSEVTKDVRLVSPEFLVSGGTVLSFWHQFNTEDTFDGGVLEITTDGGATWTDIVVAGGLFLEGGYNSTIGALGSRFGWSGISSDYPEMNEVRVSLAAFNSQTIQVRFRLAQDVLLGTPGGGWSIDDVALSNLYESCDEQTDRPPVARADSDIVMANGMVTTIVKSNDSDPDNTDGDLSGHTVEVISGPQHGATVVEPNGDVTYDHDDGNTATSDSYEYKLTDPEGNFDTAIVTITIDHGSNDVPVANDDTDTVDAGQSVTVDVKANDSDGNHSDEELTVTLETSPASGFAGVNGDGSITYTHSGDAATSDSFDYRLTDPLGAFDIATVSITINQEGEGEECRNDLCADGEEPDELTFTFVGGTCADSANSQDGKDDCTDHEAGASGMVTIKVTNKEDADYDNATVYFYGAVSEGEDFTFSADVAGDSSSKDDDFGSKIFLHIYDADGNVLLQTIEVHTSCSAPLVEGDQFGSVRLGAADINPEAQMCEAGDGRVHGSGYWDRGTGEKHDKIDFSFDAKSYKGGYKGKLKIHDKDMDLKIDAKTITSLSTGEGQECDGIVLDGVNSFTFTAVGKIEFGDEEAEGQQFFACGEDNGKNKDLPLDNLYVTCVNSCGYSTSVRIMDDSNDIDGGNIHLHDPIVDPVDNSGSASAASASNGAAPESGKEPAQGGTRSSSQNSAQSEPEGTSDTVTLEPILLSTVPAGTPMIVTAIVEMHGGVIDGTPVTLHWTTAAGIEGETTALANGFGIAVFAVTVPAGDVDYTARVDGVDSNGMRLTGF